MLSNILFDDLDKELFRIGRGRNLRRVILWRQWKCGRTRHKRLVARGFAVERARASAYNGLGPWWNAGASHMNDAFMKKHFDRLGLINLPEPLLRLRTA